MTAAAATALVRARDLHKTFRRDNGEAVKALDGVGFEALEGQLTAIVGPDGAGKTTLLRLMAGLMRAESGTLEVLGLDVSANAQTIQDRIGYMPQKFGLYEDLTVQQNLDLYADLHGIPAQERARVYPQLMEMTDLGRFTGRIAGKLSGGMKQKLGLACTLVRSPELLLLDEPTVGVDPLSRRELWAIVTQLVRERDLTVIVATSYLDEAEFGSSAAVLHLGKVLAQDAPQAITDRAGGCVHTVRPENGMTARSMQARLFPLPGVVDAIPEAGHVRLVTAPGFDGDLALDGKPLSLEPATPRFEDGFMVIFSQVARRKEKNAVVLDRTLSPQEGKVSVEVNDLVRTFGSFTAVDHVSFKVYQGEIYGLLGPNGAGKSTTFRMLCGLLPASGGTLRVGGADLRTSRAEARANLGYVAQKFSLYGDLSVDENLSFFASAYGLRGKRKQERITWAKSQFDLDDVASLPSSQLPGGYKQRLSMAAALLHEPSILFLDEATSGADPLARREFWGRITALSERGVTVIVTTHFMEEAEYCDRIVILDGGRNLAEGTPAEIRALAEPRDGHEPNMEDAFIAIIEKARSVERHNAGGSS